MSWCRVIRRLKLPKLRSQYFVQTKSYSVDLIEFTKFIHLTKQPFGRYFFRRNNTNSFQHQIINLSPPSTGLTDIHTGHESFLFSLIEAKILVFSIPGTHSSGWYSSTIFVLSNRVKLKVGHLQIGIGMSFTSQSPWHFTMHLAPASTVLPCRPSILQIQISKKFCINGKYTLAK